MTSNTYLLSIVIPTRNRQEYVVQAVHQILKCTSEKTQIIIQDNSDQNSLQEEIKSINNERIVYNYTKEKLSFVDNFSKGIEFIEGKYAILIGDDDGVLSNIEEVADFANKNNIDAVTSKVLVTYYWPNSGAKQYKCTEDKGYIRINHFTGSMREMDNLKNLKKVLNNGCQFYHSSGLPKIYHGIVKKEIIEKIIDENGTLFSGLSPDIYSSFMITLYSTKTIYLDFPFTIDGNCRKSGAGAQAQGKHTGKLEDAPHFQQNDNYEWSSLVPRVYSIQTIWADSGLKAISDFGSKELIDEFSIEKVAAYTMMNNKSILSDTFSDYLRIKNYSSKIIGWMRILPSILLGPIPNLLYRLIRRMKGFGVVGTIINDVPNIEVAFELIENKINEFKED